MSTTPDFKPWTGDPNQLQHTPGLKFHGATPTAHNVLTEGLRMIFPHRVSPRMLEGLKEDNSPLSRLTRTVSPLPLAEELNRPGLTNEQMAEIAIQQAMGNRR